MPNEITLMIIRLVLPDDIESFTSTCTQIYNVATEDLERHRTLKRKHRVYGYEDPSRYRDPRLYSAPYQLSNRCSLAQLLDEILQKPRTAFYVQEISIRGWRRMWSAQEHLETMRPENRHLPYSEGTISRLRKAVSDLVPHDEVSSWMRYIKRGSEDPIISLLILLLPNLSTLKFHHLGEDREHLCSTLYRIASMESPAAPLSCLRHVQIPACLEIPGLKLVGLFAALPSVRSIHGFNIYETGFDAYSDTDLALVAPWTSKLEDLTLVTCSINPKRLFDFLETFEALRSFTYHSGIKKYRNDQQVEFDPCWIRSALSAFAKSTLQSLTLLSHDEKRNFMGDIRCFKAVSYLHTETQLLLHQVAMHHDDTSLARALPPKLEILKLECSGLGDEMEIARLISALAKLKKEYVPALREVEVLTRNGTSDFNFSPAYSIYAHFREERFSANYEAIIEACKVQGFHLVVRAFDTNSWGLFMPTE